MPRLGAARGVSIKVRLVQPLERQSRRQQQLEPRHRARCPTLPHRFPQSMHSAQKANLQREAFYAKENITELEALLLNL